MRSQRYTWIGFGLCAATVLAAMTWVTAVALRLDRAQTEARRQAAVEEAARLALWRMDAAMTAIVAKESAWPYFAYTSFYPPERAYTRMFAALRPGEVVVPSPLLTYSPPHTRLHFQFGPDGAVSSPQVPSGNMRDLAEVGYLTHERIEEKASLLDQLARTVSHVQVADALDAPSPNLASAAVEFVEPGGGIAARESQALGKRSSTEFKVRARQMFDNVAMQQRAFPEQQLQQELSIQPLPSEQAQAAPTADFAEGTMRSVWIGDELLLIRAVTVGMEQYLQGCWLDWPALSRQMLVSVADLLPDASLVRADLEPDPDDVGRLLAALPVRLETGPIEVGERRVTPIRIALVVAWCCAAFAATTVGLLLRGTLSLSRRRAAFVSAVTHELRTPLTTFRMYTEMLANDMVKGEEKKKRYLETLHSESGRLAHLVENVLSYARLERGRGANALETVSIGALLERMEERLTQRAERASMELVVTAPPDVRPVTVRVNTAAVEQILMNLVDNACNYAHAAADRRIHLDVCDNAATPAIRVRDHGPGIAGPEAKRLFQPFTKSAHEAANSAPGIGLGLALSRRLARDLGGSLRLLPSAEGASFELTLPGE